MATSAGSLKFSQSEGDGEHCKPDRDQSQYVGNARPEDDMIHRCPRNKKRRRPVQAPAPYVT